LNADYPRLGDPIFPYLPANAAATLRGRRPFVRFRTAALLSIALIGVMFGFPAAVEAIFVPSLRQGIPNPVPVYEQILLGAGVWCLQFHWLLTPPIVLLLFTTATLTGAVRGFKRFTAPRGMRRPGQKRQALE